MSVGIQTIISDSHLPLVGDVRSHPGKDPLSQLGAQQLLADKVGQDLPGEDLRQPRIVDPGNYMEDAIRIHPALGHQVVEMGVEINPVPEGPDGRDQGHGPGRIALENAKAQAQKGNSV